MSFTLDKHGVKVHSCQNHNKNQQYKVINHGIKKKNNMQQVGNLKINNLSAGVEANTED